MSASRFDDPPVHVPSLRVIEGERPDSAMRMSSSLRPTASEDDPWEAADRQEGEGRFWTECLVTKERSDHANKARRQEQTRRDDEFDVRRALGSAVGDLARRRDAIGEAVHDSDSRT
jgi:hypothetical protein